MQSGNESTVAKNYAEVDCAFCGRKFAPHSPNQRFCSHQCRTLFISEEHRKDSDFCKTGVTRDGRKHIHLVSVENKTKYLATLQECPNCGKKFYPRRVTQYCCCAKCNWENRNRIRIEAKRLPIRKCELCGTEYQPRTKTQRFCSRKCYKKDASSRFKKTARDPKAAGYVPLTQTTRKCIVCGKDFHPKCVTQKCCSSQCSAIRYHTIIAKNAGGGGLPRNKPCVCSWCGKHFLGISKKVKYCSIECQYLGRERERTLAFERKYPKRVCTECGAEFQPKYPKQICCSDKCREARVARFGKGKRTDWSVLNEKAHLNEVESFISEVSESDSKAEAKHPSYEQMLKMSPEDLKRAYDSLSKDNQKGFKVFWCRTYGVKSYSPIFGSMPRANGKQGISFTERVANGIKYGSMHKAFSETADADSTCGDDGLSSLMDCEDDALRDIGL